MQTKNTKQGGFTLVEIAIVLVIIGLLLGGILKGQELINNAKVRSVADRQNSLKAAWFGFVDRYNFIPGDSKRAKALVPGAIARASGDLESTAGDGRLAFGESVLAMLELTGAGFLRCPQCTSLASTDTAPTALVPPSAENSLINQYSGVMSIWNESLQYAIRGAVSDESVFGRLQIHSGPRIPSNILSEVDRKIDDGIANSGDMVFNGFDPTAGVATAASIGNTGNARPIARPTDGSPSVAECMNALTDGEAGIDGEYESTSELVWRTADRTPVENNCGASVFI